MVMTEIEKLQKLLHKYKKEKCLHKASAARTISNNYAFDAQHVITQDGHDFLQKLSEKWYKRFCCWMHCYEKLKGMDK